MRKTLTIIVIIILLAGTSFILTGCGTENSNNTNQNNVNNINQNNTVDNSQKTAVELLSYFIINGYKYITMDPSSTVHTVILEKGNIVVSKSVDSYVKSTDITFNDTNLNSDFALINDDAHFNSTSARVEQVKAYTNWLKQNGRNNYCPNNCSIRLY
ncbi:MAG: hypothetical protein FWF46_09215 [Oscillospiraceae bacterium]|nr:hypothetical protein [Oscillospiraceae bacterium]